MTMKKMIALVLALTLCLCMAACGGNQDSGLGANEARYKVSVVDGLGNPCANGVIVRFMQDGVQVAMQVVDANGVAEKVLTKGEYTVELKFTAHEENYHYDSSDIVLTADQSEAQVVLYNAPSKEGQPLYAYSLQAKDKADCVAFAVGAGCTYVELTTNERNYYLFTPTEAGTYRFSLKDSEGQVGYYGSPYYVQDASAHDIIDGTVTVSVSADMIGAEGTGTTVLVIGVESEDATGILCIERIGEPQHTLSDEPWTPYQTTHTPAPFTLAEGEGKNLTYVDIKGKTEDYQLVMGSDGFYHLGAADGPVVYINLGKYAPNLSLQIMIQGDGLGGGAPLRKYFYDENGEFIKKEDYTTTMVAYIECADETYGVYPLTADLEYMIKNGGAGWWDVESPDYIFEGCNPELGWLFACCYVK